MCKVKIVPLASVSPAARRENLEEALTGEYAEELREALRKAGVEDALGVFEDFVSENLGDLVDDDDESEEL